MRVVLHAEGAGELLGSMTRLPAVGEALPAGALGPAHELIGRLAPGARFDAPNRIRGHLARGSDLLYERTLRQLLTWVRPQQQPGVAIVLVDADGDQQRATRLRAVASTVKVPTVVVASVQEFEAWLIADHACVAAILGVAAGLPGATDSPEALPPRKAKELLAQWMGGAGRTDAAAQRDVRRSIALTCDLGVLRDRCRAFATFASELARHASP